MLCGNFLMPFKGTKIYENFKDYIKDEDYDLFNSKSAFLEKNLEIRKEIEYQMYKFQDDYFHSDFYAKNCRNFDENDTLGLRFKELKEEFSTYKSIWEEM